MINKDFYNLLKEDEFGLLEQSEQNKPITENDRLIESFLEIIKFYEDNNKLPELNDIHERKLAVRLKTFKENGDAYIQLKDFDKYNFLNDEDFKINNSESDDFGLLDITEEDKTLINMVNVPKITKDRSDPDLIAKREKCLDFEKFDPLFIDCQNKLKNGILTLSDFVESQMKEGDFFVQNGMLIYVDKIYDPYRGNSNKINKRTRCIYENGLESNALLRSLGKSLSANGFSVKKSNILTPEDTETGYIYILKSLSSDPKIQNIKDLYKIGFSTTEVEERIKNAEIDPTYLMAPVKIVYKIKCFNLDPHRFERLIHRFFEEVCLDVQIADNSGKLYTPKEWFSVPLSIIEEAVDLIISGDIINYEYDKFSKSIKKKLFAM
jgi:hypothetical protein